MNHIEADDGDNGYNAADDDDEAVFFAEVHAEYIRKTLEYYKCMAYDKWIICQTSDNTRVNGKIVEVRKIPHVPCRNHLLNYKVNSIVASTPYLQKKIEIIQTTITQCKK